MAFSPPLFRHIREHTGSLGPLYKRTGAPGYFLSLAGLFLPGMVMRMHPSCRGAGLAPLRWAFLALVAWISSGPAAALDTTAARLAGCALGGGSRAGALLWGLLDARAPHPAPPPPALPCDNTPTGLPAPVVRSLWEDSPAGHPRPPGHRPPRPPRAWRRPPIRAPPQGRDRGLPPVRLFRLEDLVGLRARVQGLC